MSEPPQDSGLKEACHFLFSVDCNSLLVREGGLRACDGGHEATVAPWLVSAVLPTGHASPGVGALLTLGLEYHRAGLCKVHQRQDDA